MKTYSTKLIEINSRDEDFPGFKWLLKAVDFEPGSPISNVLSIEKEQAIATDGYRLHIYTPVLLYPKGIYKILLRQKHYLILSHTKHVSFPDYQKVIPDYNKFNEFKMSGIVEKDYSIIIKNMEDHAINFRYFNDLADWDIETIYIGAAKEPIVFGGIRKQALIMPMRI